MFINWEHDIQVFKLCVRVFSVIIAVIVMIIIIC